MTSKAERLQILDMIQNGVITAEEGSRLLRALDQVPLEEDAAPVLEAEAAPTTLPGSSDDDPASAAFADRFPESEAANPVEVLTDHPYAGRQVPFDVEKWRRWWLYPMWVGIAVTVLGGLLMYLALQASGVGFWFACAWAPFMLGVAIMMLALASRTSKWLHLRVRQSPGEWPQTIAISFPLPLRLAAWFVRNFGRYIPQLDRIGLDEVILALGDKTSPEAPFYIEVDEGEDGEKVEIYIG